MKELQKMILKPSESPTSSDKLKRDNLVLVRLTTTKMGTWILKFYKKDNLKLNNENVIT